MIIIMIITINIIMIMIIIIIIPQAPMMFFMTENLGPLTGVFTRWWWR